MSKICWDTMLLIYLLEGQSDYRKRVDTLLARARRRGDRLFTTCLSVAEMMAGTERSAQPQKAIAIREVLEEIGFSFLPFDEGAINTFSRLRARENLKIADSIHLACAASAGIDLFLTGDKQLMRIDVPGIQFIADFNSPIL